MTERWYRYYDRSYGGSSSNVEVCEDSFVVLRTTPKGVWLHRGYESKKFVLRDATKRWACPTREEAMESFIARKRRQLGFLRAQVTQVELALDMALAGETRKSRFEFDIEALEA